MSWKDWNKLEPTMNWSSVRLSTISILNEKFGFNTLETLYEVYLPIVLKRYKEFFVDSIRGIDQFSGEIDAKLEINSNFLNSWIEHQEESDRAATSRLVCMIGKKILEMKTE